MTTSESPQRSTSPADLDKTLRDFLEQFAKEKAEYEATQIKCGIVGRSGVGKSSLINAIVDQKLAPVGSSKETTLEAHEYIHRGLVLVDLPGCGTKSYPTSNYVDRLSLESYDLFIFVTESRFFEDEATIYGQLTTKLKMPCFLVRSKFDAALANAEYDGSTQTETELKKEIEDDIRKNLAPLTVERIYAVSSRWPAMYDLPSLLDDIINKFSGMKQMRLENDFAAWSRGALARKKKNALRLAAWYASLSAVNGLNPIIGLDGAVDLALLCKLVQEVAAIYNFTPEQNSYWEKLLGGRPHGVAVMHRMIALISKYGSEAAITMALKSLGKREVSRVFSYVLPIVGHLVSCGAGYYLTYNFGATLVEEYHNLAGDILSHLRLPQPGE